MKYQNKDGIALNFIGNNSTSVLVREVISEAILMLRGRTSSNSTVEDTIEFLKENFDIKDENE